MGPGKGAQGGADLEVFFCRNAWSRREVLQIAAICPEALKAAKNTV